MVYNLYKESTNYKHSPSNSDITIINRGTARCFHCFSHVSSSEKKKLLSLIPVIILLFHLRDSEHFGKKALLIEIESFQHHVLREEMSYDEQVAEKSIRPMYELKSTKNI